MIILLIPDMNINNILVIGVGIAKTVYYPTHMAVLSFSVSSDVSYYYMYYG